MAIDWRIAQEASAQVPGIRAQQMEGAGQRMLAYSELTQRRAAMVADILAERDRLTHEAAMNEARLNKEQELHNDRKEFETHQNKLLMDAQTANTANTIAANTFLSTRAMLAPEIIEYGGPMPYAIANIHPGVLTPEERDQYDKFQEAFNQALETDTALVTAYQENGANARIDFAMRHGFITKNAATLQRTLQGTGEIPSTSPTPPPAQGVHEGATTLSPRINPLPALEPTTLPMPSSTTPDVQPSEPPPVSETLVTPGDELSQRALAGDDTAMVAAALEVIGERGATTNAVGNAYMAVASTIGGGNVLDPRALAVAHKALRMRGDTIFPLGNTGTYLINIA